jgi:hypothetical protein
MVLSELISSTEIDYTNTEPPFEIPHNPNWDGKHKIVAIDPYGHITQVVHRDLIKSGMFNPLRALVQLAETF